MGEERGRHRKSQRWGRRETDIGRERDREGEREREGEIEGDGMQ